ncbi:GNAT family N-acetyltransferase [Devosia sp.]|uniref:GNAT family N-acetyltransferase n=1 Tax=Devosia sp. TaxID=1871048 RepID=UPI003A933CE6
MPATLFRQARPEDASAIGTLVRAAYQKWVPILGREPRPMLVDYDAVLRVHRFDLLEAEGKVIGLIETESRVDHFWLENIAVLPSAQGRGIGRDLLAHAESLARDAGHHQVRLLTNGKMAANRQLYAAVGYTEDVEEPFMDGTVVYLSKTLKRLETSHHPARPSLD